ncbi:MAG: NAD(P)-dependent alcohol dehydrogenase [Acidimicrobiales bacterium]|nr:NAD(P)-dependent alcohol dehydrogenase [Acidimicrobiales bacterium]
MTTETQAAIVRSVDGDFVVEDVILADLKPDEALVEIHACGICHMDVEAKGLMALPCVMGHEGAGIVVKVGSDVSSVRPGDRVILGYGFCGQCQPCNHGQPFFCDESWDLTFSGKRLDGGSTATFRDGQPLTAAFFQQSSFARHAITPARSLVNISDDVPWHIAAALPCGFLTGVGSSKNVLGVESGSTLLVRGVGAVGMGAIVGAKMAGCTTIVASDLQSSRLNLAREFGATTTLNAAVDDFDEWRGQYVPRGFTHILDTTGNKAVFENSIDSLATGGNMAYAILPSPMEEFSFKPFGLFEKCATLTAVSFGSALPAELIPEMLEWWLQGDFPVDRLIATFPFDDINTAVKAGHSGEVIKPVLVMD